MTASSPKLTENFSCQQPKPYTEDAVRRWPVFVEELLRGARALLILAPNGARFISPTGAPIDAASALAHEVHRRLDPAYNYDNWWWILDGHLIDDPESKPFGQRYVVFDLLAGQSISLGSDRFPAIARRAHLYTLLKDIDCRCVQMTPGWVAYSHDEVMTYYDMVLRIGGRGVVVKDPKAHYYCGRSDAWLSITDVKTISLPVVGFKRGTGLFAKTLGALLVEHNGRTCNVGAGFTRSQRETLYNQCIADFDTLIKDRRIRLDFDEQSTNGALLHCRFIRFEDKANRCSHDETKDS